MPRGDENLPHRPFGSQTPPGQYGRAAATHVIGKAVDTEDEHWNV
jgi:hypothetical protein